MAINLNFIKKALLGPNELFQNWSSKKKLNIAIKID
jgi:hypothetical protein